MNEATISVDGLRVTVAIESGDPWPIARAAFEAARDDHHHHPPHIHMRAEGGSHAPALSDPKKRGKTSERIRAIAAEILSDGRVHERREISKTVREAGLKGEMLDRALKVDERFEKAHNVMGRPTYRDLSVPSGYPPVERTPDEDKPEWMRNPKPAEWTGSRTGGALASNGAAADG